MAKDLALYTVVYPAAARFLEAWYRSVAAQTDSDFDLWISLDGMTVDAATAAMNDKPHANWVVTAEGATYAQVRQQVLVPLTETYEAIIFVDSDDLLEPSRVQAARAALADYDLVGCALRLIDDAGYDRGITFAPPRGVDPATTLQRNNVFGLSNTAYRSELLRRCLPLPDKCRLIDWLLATRAWALGARLYFDATPHMAYRQYSANTAPVLPPYNAAGVLQATKQVLDHYHYLLDGSWVVPEPQRHVLTAAQAYVAAFSTLIATSPAILDQYVQRLNRIPPQYIWWWTVAHPDLEELWRS